MNLAKHDPETEMLMDMTPMIDVVFLLIIFFMIITDLTQQDLEELELPVAEFAVEDKPDPEVWRPIINIQFDGKMIVRRKVYYDPEIDELAPDPYFRIKEWLAMAADKMKKDHFDPTAGTGPMIPDEPLLLRVDQCTPFKHVQKILEFCGQEGIQIWKIQLAVTVPEANKDKKEGS